jgi:hypothetical protein
MINLIPLLSFYNPACLKIKRIDDAIPASILKKSME